MTVDYRKLLKDCIRGTIYDLDVPPSSPTPIDKDGEEISPTKKERRAFSEVMDEVLREPDFAELRKRYKQRAGRARKLARIECDERGNLVPIFDQ